MTKTKTWILNHGFGLGLGHSLSHGHGLGLGHVLGLGQDKYPTILLVAF